MAQQSSASREFPAPASPAVPPHQPRGRRLRLRRMLQVFIVISLLLHLGGLAAWMLPDKFERARQQAAKERIHREAVERQQAQKRAVELARQHAVEVTRQQVTAELKNSFESIVAKQVKPDAAEDLWAQILRQIQGDVDRYAQAAGDVKATDQEVLRQAQEMQAKMMDELLARLKGMSARHLADAFLKRVEQDVVPRVAEFYRQQIDQKIGAPLSAEGSRIAREEAAATRAGRQAAAEALVKAEQSATAAANELTGAKTRLETALKTPPGGKPPTTMPAGIAQKEQGAVDRASAALRQAEQGIATALEKRDALGGKTVGDLRGAARGDAATAAGKAGAAAKAVGAGDANAAAQAAGDAADAAKQLAGRIKAVRDNIGKDGTDPNDEARAGLRDARDGAIKADLDRSFRETFKGTAAPRLSEKLTDVFGKGMENAGVKDEKVVEEVRQRVQVALNEKIGGGVDAGGAGTQRLTKAERLDDLPPGLAPGVSKGGNGKDGDGKAGDGKAGTGKTGDGKAGDGKDTGGDAGARLTKAAQDLAKAHMGNLNGTAGGGNGDGTGKGNDGTAGADGGKGGGGKTGGGNQAANGNDAGDGDDDGTDGPGGGAGGPRGRRGAVAAKTTNRAKEIAGKGMGDIANDAGGDGAATQLARGNGKGGPGGGPGSGDGEGDGIDAGLLDKVAGLRDGVRSGRLTLLDGGPDGMGPGGGNGPGKPGDPSDVGGMPGGSGWADSSISRLAQIRRQALVNGQIAQSSRWISAPLEGDYNKVTAGIHERDQAAARGQAIQRVAMVADPVRAAQSISDVPAPRRVLVPKTTDAEPIGHADNAAPFKPTFRSIAFGAAPFRNKPIQIDGDLSEWADIPSLPMEPGGAGAKDAALRKVPQSVKVQWDNAALYVACDVIDADNKITQSTAVDFWAGDAMEIWIDPQNTKVKERTADTHQFWAWAVGASTDPTKVGGEAYMDDKGNKYTACGPEKMQVGSKKTAEGWTLEVRIPLTSMRHADLSPGRILGMNFSICTGTPLLYYWAGMTNIATSVRPDTWGDLLLAGSDGRLECLDKLTPELKKDEKAQPARSQRIGQPLKIRVTDMDMNLSDIRKDKVSVTVSTRRGQRQVVVLEETTETSGVFEGSIQTTLDTGDAIAGVLSLFDGEKIDLSYLDQARGNGARNVEVKLSLPTAAAVVTAGP